MLKCLGKYYIETDGGLKSEVLNISRTADYSTPGPPSHTDTPKVKC